ncbi:MAG: hypothetical protein JOZ27_04345 [Caulobacteraceae bacterium]|nr:hypothetical protein [Caulobacteraceae bacterium]
MRPAARTLAPWGALALPAIAWFAYQQGLGTAVRLACRASGGAAGLVAGLLALAVCAGAARLAWPHASREVSEPHDLGRRFVARLALGAAGVAPLAIAFQMLAAALVPPCAR